MIDHSDLPKVRSDKKKTKRGGVSRSKFSKEVPVENDRDSTLNLFVGRCCAAFLRFQINILLDLEAYYNIYIYCE